MIVTNAAAIDIDLPSVAAIVVWATVTISPVTLDTPGFRELSQQCAAEGHRMLGRFEENWRNGSNRFDAPSEQAFGAVLDGRLVGLCGRNYDPYDQRPRAGRVRHLYVDPGCRHLGIGRLLIDAVVDGAMEWFDYLNTNCPPEAAPFYERLGFARFAAERITHRLDLRQLTEQP
jgi:GNAT superfamily N-acetyltransferase